MDENLPAVSGPMLQHGEPQAFRRAVGKTPPFLSSVTDPQQGADAIVEGYGDALMLARQLLADPQYPAKVGEGRAAEIVWCDQSNECIRRLLLNLSVRCHLNPRAGREAAS